MQVHFIGFAAEGDPNAHRVSWIQEWPAYKENEERNSVYNATLQDALNLHIEEDTYREEHVERPNQRWRFVNKL